MRFKNTAPKRRVDRLLRLNRLLFWIIFNYGLRFNSAEIRHTQNVNYEQTGRQCGRLNEEQRKVLRYPWTEQANANQEKLADIERKLGRMKSQGDVVKRVSFM